MRNQILIRGVVALAVLWLMAFTVIRVAGSMKPTAEKVGDYLEEFSLDDLPDDEARKKEIAKLADMMNQMEAAELDRLRNRSEGDPRRVMMEKLTPEEQFYFFEKRVGRAFEQMMQSFNAMERSERQRMVERSLRRIQESEGDREGGLEDQDPEMAGKIAEAGMKAYYSEASVETKIDLAPLMEEMQRSMSRMGGPR